MVRDLGPGSHFGEIALISNVKRTLSVKSVTASQLLCLSRATFIRILGNIKKYLKEDYSNSEGVDGSFIDGDPGTPRSKISL